MSTANYNRPEDEEAKVAGGPGEVEAEVVSDAAAELAKAKAEAAQFKDQLLRALAEAENTRRRSQREREDSARYAAEALAEDEALKNLVDGIAATERQFLAALERHNIKRIDPLGEKFDAHLHQA